MATQLQMRRGTQSEHSSFTGAEGEVSVNTTNDSLHVHDGSTASGFELARVDGSNWAITNDITTTSNINVGTVTADGLTVGSSTITETASDLTISSTDDLFLEANGNRVFQAWDNGSLQYVAITNGSQELAEFNANGDISFYEDTGTTPKFFWDSSAESLGIGTTSPSEKLEIRNDVAASTDLDPTAIKLYNNSDGGSAIEFSNGVAAKSKISFGVTSTGAGTDDSYLSFSTGANAGLSEAMRIDSSGRVGIGTSSPTSDLSVGSTTTSSGDIALRTTKTAAVITPSNTAAGGMDIDVGWASGGQGPLTFSLGGGEKARLDASGNLLVGTTFSDGAGGTTIDADGGFKSILTSGAGGDTLISAISGVSNGYQILVDTSNNQTYKWHNGGTPSMTLDSSGNLLVGTTSIDFNSYAGFRVKPAGNVYATTENDSPALFNRRSSDGNIITLRKDGSTVGSIRSISGDSIGIGNGDAGLRFVSSTNRIQPVDMDNGLNSDALTSLGDTNKRFKDIYRSGSTISTSDRNMKQDIRDLTDAERNVAVAAKGLLKAFRFIDTVAAEGDSANIHFGIIAQDLAAAFEAEGLDANDYQVYKSDTFTDDDGNEQTRLGICYENLLAFIIAAI